MLGPIKYIELQNWVSYDHGRFDFHPNVNMIIGPSGHGKSAMMAAFFKLLYNRPTGDEFVSWWGGETKLITAMDDWVLEYSKKKSKARYTLTIDDKITEFTAFGSGVPDNISRLVCMSDELNIQKQFKKKAPIFLLSETPGDAAKKLNTFANLTGIDETIQAGRSDIQESKKEINHLETQLDTKEKELMHYQGLDDLEALIIQAEKKKKLIEECSLKIAAVEKISTRITSLKNEQMEIEKWQKITDKVPMVISATKQRDTAATGIKLISGKIANIEDLRRERIAILQFGELSPLIEKCNVNFKQVEKYGTLFSTILGVKSTIKLKRGALRLCQKKGERLKKELKRNFPDVCPLCNGVVDKELL